MDRSAVSRRVSWAIAKGASAPSVGHIEQIVDKATDDILSLLADTDCTPAVQGVDMEKVAMDIINAISDADMDVLHNLTGDTVPYPELKRMLVAALAQGESRKYAT